MSAVRKQAPASIGISAKRRSMLGKIHVARKQLDMEMDDYRQLLFDATGKMSARDCSDAQLVTVIDRLKAKGFKPLPKSGRKGVAQHPVATKARALWISLYQLGEVHNPSEQALEAFAKRQLGCEKLIWAKQSHGPALIEALKDWGRRAGWQQTDMNGRKLSVLGLRAHLCDVILAKLKEEDAVPKGWDITTAARQIGGFESDAAWTVETYAHVAGLLGEELRKYKGPAQ